MGADAFYVYFGIRYKVESEEECERLEAGDDPRLGAARKAHLQTCLDRLTDGEDYFLLIGTQIGLFGIEGKVCIELSEEDVRHLVDRTRQRLRDGGFQEEPRFHFQMAAQY